MNQPQMVPMSCLNESPKCQQQLRAGLLEGLAALISEGPPAVSPASWPCCASSPCCCPVSLCRHPGETLQGVPAHHASLGTGELSLQTSGVQKSVQEGCCTHTVCVQPSRNPCTHLRASNYLPVITELRAGRRLRAARSCPAVWLCCAGSVALSRGCWALNGGGQQVSHTAALSSITHQYCFGTQSLQ